MTVVQALLAKVLSAWFAPTVQGAQTKPIVRRCPFGGSVQRFLAQTS
jgi:hypothetical protein